MLLSRVLGEYKCPQLLAALAVPYATTSEDGALQDPRATEPRNPWFFGISFLFSAGCGYCFQCPCLGVIRLALAFCSTSRFCGSPCTGPQAAAFRLPGDDELLAAAAQSVGGGGQSPERKATQAHWRAGCSGRADCGPSGRGGLAQQVSEPVACSSLSCLVFAFVLKESKAFVILFYSMSGFTNGFAGLGIKPRTLVSLGKHS